MFLFRQTPACDLKSLLPLKLKRQILQALQQGCPAYEARPERQKEILNNYKQYLTAVRSKNERTINTFCYPLKLFF